MSLFRGCWMAALCLSLAVASAERIAAQERSPQPPTRRPTNAAPVARGAGPRDQPARQAAQGGVHRPMAFGGIPQPRKPRDPFQLTAEQQAVVDLVLRTWEAKQKGIKTFSCEFTLWEYGGAFGNGKEPRSSNDGALYYAPPDKGRYEVFDKDGNSLEHWVCDGRAIYEFKTANKELVEHTLPEEMRGKAIADTPLPFVFGSTAEKMRQRYWMRVTAPAAQGNENFLKKGQLLLEAIPKFKHDAANFQKVEIILNERDMLPYAINQFLPSHTPKNPSRKAYEFRAHKVNGGMDQFNRIFSKPRKPIGWTHVVEKPGEPLPDDKVQLPSLDRDARLPPANKVKAR
jgi:TIGR03009 family protein